jgi:hypothetical protein
MDLPDRDVLRGVALVGPASLVFAVIKRRAYDSDHGTLDETKPVAGTGIERERLVARIRSQVESNKRTQGQQAPSGPGLGAPPQNGRRTWAAATGRQGVHRVDLAIIEGRAPTESALLQSANAQRMTFFSSANVLGDSSSMCLSHSPSVFKFFS